MLLNNRIVCCVKTSCLLALIGVSGLMTTPIWARGVSPYLPLNLAPEIERQVERVLILADTPVVRRPIALAVVLDALPKACLKDRALCERVRRYLDGFTQTAAVTQLELGAAVRSGDSDSAVPNAHGLAVNDAWSLNAAAYYQPSDYLLANVGAVAYQGRAKPTGSVLSVGVDIAQLDIGFRDHWFSPLVDSSMLISTEAPTMPSITLSNYKPIGPLGISYEVFLARMSKQEGIQYFGGTTTGNPRLAGLQTAIVPATGYVLAVNRVMQYGGGARNTSGLSDLRDALFVNSNRPDVAGQQLEFGNQVASISSSITFPGATPFAVRVEYAGEDNAYAGHYRLGETDLSLGIDFPKLWNNYDLTYEVSEWQNVWYTHHLYPDGLTNDGHAIGHWFGDERRFNDAIGGSSQMLRVGWHRDSGDYLRATYRTLSYDAAWRGVGVVAAPYSTLNELGVDYYSAWRDRGVSAGLFVGRDVLGQKFARISGSIDLAGRHSANADTGYIEEDSESNTSVFVDLGANRSDVTNIFSVSVPNYSTGAQIGYHLGLGARRSVSTRSDLGARLELDRVDGRQLLSVRMLDYRFKMNKKLALTGFFGAGRYNVELPAVGYYFGAGLQYMNLFRRWDLGIDLRRYDKLGRDKVLATDPPSTPDRTRMFFDVDGTSAYLSRRF